MTQLRHVPIWDYKERYKLTALVETGTEGGDGVQAGLSAGMEVVASVEIIPIVFQVGVARFGGESRVHLFLGDSATVLPDMLRLVEGRNVLFWLDAHLPQCYDKLKRYEDGEIVPLRREVGVISSLRDCSADVVLIDDMGLVDPSFWPESENLARWVPNPRATAFSLADIKATFPQHRCDVIPGTDAAVGFFPVAGSRCR